MRVGALGIREVPRAELGQLVERRNLGGGALGIILLIEGGGLLRQIDGRAEHQLAIVAAAQRHDHIFAGDVFAARAAAGT